MDKSQLFQDCVRFVGDQWTPLASAAWSRYMVTDQTKGAIVIPVDVVEGWLRGQIRPFTAGYMSSGRDVLDIAIATYDPEREIVAMFTDRIDVFLGASDSPEAGEIPADTKFAFFVASHEPPPPEAHRQTAN